MRMDRILVATLVLVSVTVACGRYGPPRPYPPDPPDFERDPDIDYDAPLDLWTLFDPKRVSFTYREDGRYLHGTGSADAGPWIGDAEPHAEAGGSLL